MAVMKGKFSPRSSSLEVERRQSFVESLQNTPVPATELLANLTVYLPRQELSRALALAEIYREHIVGTNGVLVEFGTCYGRTAALLTNFRGIYEPFNFTRKLVVFDTFSGLRGVDAKDGSDPSAVDGNYSSGEGYENHLESVLAYHESESPISHIRKHEIVKGDAVATVTEYLKRHPETIIAMAYFDFDIFAPTKSCLEAIRPHLHRDSLLVFDELNCPEYPGETVALAEVFGLGKCHLSRSPLTPWMSYTTCEHIVG